MLIGRGYKRLKSSGRCMLRVRGGKRFFLLSMIKTETEYLHPRQFIEFEFSRRSRPFFPAVGRSSGDNHSKYGQCRVEMATDSHKVQNPEI